jgi:hypothetical protein
VQALRRQIPAAVAGQTCSVLNLRGGLGRVRDPARTREGGMEARSSRKHVGQVAAHHGQLAANIGKASGAMMPDWVKAALVAEELHGTGNKTPQGSKEIAGYAFSRFSQHFRRVVMAALHETAERVATKGVCDVIVLRSMPASVCPDVTKGGERADAHMAASHVLQGFIVQPEEGAVGDVVNLHAAGAGGDAMEQGLRAVSGPKARQLCRAGCIDSADECGQLSKLCGGREKESVCRRWAEIWELAVYVLSGVKCVTLGGCEGAQVGGDSGEGCGRSHRTGEDGSDACFRGKASHAKAPQRKMKMEADGCRV